MILSQKYLCPFQTDGLSYFKLYFIKYAAEISSDLDAQQTQINNIAEEVEFHDSEITSLNDDVSSQDNRLDSVEDSVDEWDDKITVLKVANVDITDRLMIV